MSFANGELLFSLEDNMINVFLLSIGIGLMILSVVLAIVKYYKSRPTDSWEGTTRPGKKPKKTVSVILFIAGFLLLITSQSFVIIDSGHTGIKVMLGQVKQQTVQSGFAWKAPIIENIVDMNNQQQDLLLTDEVWSETSERTALYYSNITITYQIDPDKSAWIYTNISNYKDSLITNVLVSSAVKSSSKQLEDSEATNRASIEPLVLETLQASLDDKYGDTVIHITKVSIENADFEEAYNKAISEKQQAQIAYEKQAIENQQAIEKAEAEAEVKLKAAEAEAEANELLEESLSDKVLNKNFIEKWDGELPEYMGSEDLSILIPGKTQASEE